MRVLGFGLVLSLLLVSPAIAQKSKPAPSKAAPASPAPADTKATGNEAAQWNRIRSIRKDAPAPKRALTSFASASNANSRVPALVLIHEDKTGSAFRVIGVEYYVDGRRVYGASDKDGVLRGKGAVEVHSESLRAGKYRIKAIYTLKGNGYGIFSYMSRYKLRISDTKEVTYHPNKRMLVRVMLKESATAPVSKRFRVGFDVDEQHVKGTVTEGKWKKPGIGRPTRAGK